MTLSKSSAVIAVWVRASVDEGLMRAFGRRERVGESVAFNAIAFELALIRGVGGILRY
jgi:hypothetical protein